MEAFQSALDHEFRYLSNATALRPDEFLAQGGGQAHAVCMVRSEHHPAHYGYYTVNQAFTQDGAAVPPGDYVPVDYEHVGGLSF